MPQVLDPALMRPGRFDRIIYMPLPDFGGRKKIFHMYLNKLPVSAAINVDVIAKATERYSGADIKNICDSIAQEVAPRSGWRKEHKVLEISQEDFISAIKKVKPAATLAQIKEYETFKNQL